MVHFEPADEAAATKRKSPKEATSGVAPVTYLPGAAPGMKRRSPLESVATPSDYVPRLKTVFERGDAFVAPEVSSTHRDDAGDNADDADDDLNDAEERDDGDSTADQRERAEKVLLHRLRGRSLSTIEALQVLNAAGLDSGEASAVVAKFTELEYLDEVKLADQIIHSHNVRKGLGRNGVEAEMRRRKLDPSVMMDKLEELPDDEAERAIELAGKRIQQMDRFDDQTIDRRLTGFLMRKGYSSSSVRLAVKAALDGRGGGSSTVRFR